MEPVCRQIIMKEFVDKFNNIEDFVDEQFLGSITLEGEDIIEIATTIHQHVDEIYSDINWKEQVAQRLDEMLREVLRLIVLSGKCQAILATLKKKLVVDDDIGNLGHEAVDTILKFEKDYESLSLESRQALLDH